MDQTYGAMTIAQLGALIQTGRADPVAVIEVVLDAIERHPDRAIFTALTPDRARSEATASAERIRHGRSRGLLDGIPLAWKDLFDMAGAVTTAGSKVLAHAPPAPADAPVVAALREAGMVSVGRTNLSEFAFSGLGLNPTYGTPRNPISQDRPRIPGGSSSGSAVAVAAGLVPVAIGTDTGGSVRIPAAFNGLVGFKATRGRYPMQGVFPLARSLDALGPLCRTVQDAVWVDAAMRGRGAPTVTARPVAGLTVVVPDTVVFEGLEPGVAAAFEAALHRLAAAGVTIRHSRLAAFETILDLIARHGPLVTAEAFALHHERVAGPDAAAMDPRVVARIRVGERIALPDYLALVEARERLIAEVEAELGSSLVAYPTIAHVAPAIEPLERDADLFVATNVKTLRNTMLGNFLDWCGVSLPCGTGEAGMPVGFLLSATRDRDLDLLAAALSVEAIVAGG